MSTQARMMRKRSRGVPTIAARSVGSKNRSSQLWEREEGWLQQKNNERKRDVVKTEIWSGYDRKRDIY